MGKNLKEFSLAPFVQISCLLIFPTPVLCIVCLKCSRICFWVRCNRYSRNNQLNTDYKKYLYYCILKYYHIYFENIEHCEEFNKNLKLLIKQIHHKKTEQLTAYYNNISSTTTYPEKVYIVKHFKLTGLLLGKKENEKWYNKKLKELSEKNLSENKKD